MSSEHDTLSHLEALVQRLVAGLTSLRRRNAALETELAGTREALARVSELEARCRQQAREMARLKGTRAEARQRIEGLLENLRELDP